MRVLAVVLAVGAGALAGCGSGRPKVASGATEVVVQDNIFTPPTLRVRAGTEVTFRNQGFSPHRLAQSDATQSFGSGPFGVVSDQFRQGARYRYTFTAPGTYDYYCSIHGLPSERMHGRVVVQR